MRSASSPRAVSMMIGTARSRRRGAAAGRPRSPIRPASSSRARRGRAALLGEHQRLLAVAGGLDLELLAREIVAQQLVPEGASSSTSRMLRDSPFTFSVIRPARGKSSASDGPSVTSAPFWRSARCSPVAAEIDHLGDVGGVVADALDVLGDEQEVRRRRDVVRILHHVGEQLAEDASCRNRRPPGRARRPRARLSASRAAKASSTCCTISPAIRAIA